MACGIRSARAGSSTRATLLGLENRVTRARVWSETIQDAGRRGYFQSQRQNPPRLRVRPTAMFLARRVTRRGLPEATALMSLEILAAR
jgi:hypothetical protein